ncbi:MAG: hypothetical protein LBV75_07955, partial [Paludibacter sp.]|nr:hypothetical protein [Paludibacter sp.]
MKQRRISILLILMSLQFTNMLLYGQKQEKILIESKEMAIKISDIILKSVYNGNTHNLKHFNIALGDSVWIVTNETKQNNRLCLQFSAKDCQILSDIPDNWSIDETSALKIAEIIWKSIYGKSILRKKP